MFEKLLRDLKELDGARVPVTLELDGDGFLDRCCPSDHCGSEFKVLSDDWRNKVPDDRASCPFCGHGASPKQFNTAEQVEHIKRTALAEIKRVFHNGLREGARDFNRRQPRNSFLTMRMDVRSSSPSRPLPPAAEAIMRTEFTCPSCACRYRVVGSAFFCPACGHCSADQTFEQTVARVRKSVVLFADLDTKLGRDDAALLRTQLLEGGLSDLVTAFQHLAEITFPRLPGATGIRLRRNVFQNVGDGSAVWVSGGGRAFTSILDATEMTDLERLFQQRHLLEHRDGFVDQTYLDRTNDRDYIVGTRLVIKESSIARLADLVSKLSAAMRADLP
jgi:hypothetical protein